MPDDKPNWQTAFVLVGLAVVTAAFVFGMNWIATH